MKFIKSRLNNTIKNAPYSKEEILLIDRIEILNKRGRFNKYESDIIDVRCV